MLREMPWKALYLHRDANGLVDHVVGRIKSGLCDVSVCYFASPGAPNGIGESSCYIFG